MLSSRRRFALACLLAAVPAWALAAPEAEAPADNPSAGQLLVAAPGMNDPRFARTVILMVKHDKSGALGLAINRPLGDKPVADLLRAFGEDPGNAQGTLTVLAGGPLQLSAGFVVHSSEYRRTETIVLNEHLAVSPPRPVLRDLAVGHGPRKRMLVLGYAGWAPRQLEAEMSLHVWVTAVGSPELVFDMDRAKVWDAAFAQRIISL